MILLCYLECGRRGFPGNVVTLYEHGSCLHNYVVMRVCTRMCVRDKFGSRSSLTPPHDTTERNRYSVQQTETVFAKSIQPNVCGYEVGEAKERGREDGDGGAQHILTVTNTVKFVKY